MQPSTNSILNNRHCDSLHLRTLDPKRDAGAPATTPDEKPLEKPSPPDFFIVCQKCTHVVTHADQRISVDGAHKHTFANPHGLVFDIGCFKNVTGCGLAGPTSNEFSWFSGYAWRIVVCGMCLSHLGWQFVSNAGDMFYGLILDRIAEAESGGDSGSHR